MIAWPGVNAAKASPHVPLPPRARLARLALLTALHVFALRSLGNFLAVDTVEGVREEKRVIEALPAKLID